LIKKHRAIINITVLFLFCLGYFLTASSFVKNGLEYFFLTILTITSCCLLLLYIYKPITFGLPIWIMFSYFIIAYYLKFYWLIFNPNFASRGFYLLPRMIDSEEILINTYRIVTYSFVVFCTIAWYFLLK